MMNENRDTVNVGAVNTGIRAILRKMCIGIVSIELDSIITARGSGGT
jgi:hypothetical protein